MSIHPIRRHAIRTAAVATGLVAVILAALLTATDLVVQHGLVDGVDQRLEERLDRFTAGSAAALQLPTAPDPDFDEPVLTWVVDPGGGTRAAGGTPALPAALRTVRTATVATVGGTEFRFNGIDLPGGQRVVVAASLVDTSRTARNLVIAELIIGPVLLLLVFSGALVIGRRVAGPVERMRRRQLAFTADASHELRTPLSVIQAEASLALSGSDTELRAALARVNVEGRRMRSIIDDLLWLARYDSEPAHPEPETLDLATLAAASADRFRSLAAQRGVRIDLAVPSTPVLIAAPPEWVHRLIAVLIDNACRHACEGGHVCVQASVFDTRHAQLSVTDDGDGIPEAELPNIFERFHRATSKGEGAGLGLAIADAVVRGTHGSWEIGNQPSGGARFAVTWAVRATA